MKAHKYLLFTLLLLFSSTAWATDYYVKNGGSDGAAGTSDGTAWETLDKVMTSAVAGDTVYLKRGSIWYEQLTVPASNMTFDAYDTGADPIISGGDLVTGWAGSNPYTATVTGVWQVFFDGEYMLLAHEPDDEYYTADGQVYDRHQVSETGDDMTYSQAQITGATLVCRPSVWFWMAYLITGYSSNIITLDTSMGGANEYSSVWMSINEPYYLMDKAIFLDTNGEWFHDGSSTLTLRSATDPDLSVVHAAKRAYGIYAISKSALSISNIEVKHAYKAGIYLYNCAGFTLDTVNVHHNGTQKYSVASNADDRGFALYVSTTNGGTIIDSTFSDSLNDCVYFNDADNIVFGTSGHGNTVQDVDMLGNYSPRSQSLGIFSNSSSSGNTISYNTITNISSGGIHFQNANTTVSYNTISDVIQGPVDDAGAIYCYGANTDGSTVAYNDISGVGLGGGGGSSPSAGIYLDAFAEAVTVDHNTMDLGDVASTLGIFLHMTNDCIVSYNTIENAYYGIFLGPYYSIAPPSRPWMTGNALSYNILLNNTYHMYWQTWDTSPTSNNEIVQNFGTSDYNQFMPDGAKFYWQCSVADCSPYTTTTYSSLAAWTAGTGKDINSTIYTGVSITTSDAYAAESELDTGAVIISCINCVGGESVDYVLSGTAVDNTDYSDDDDGTINVFPTTVIFTPIGDTQCEGTEQIIVTLENCIECIITDYIAYVYITDNPNDCGGEPPPPPNLRIKYQSGGIVLRYQSDGIKIRR